MCLSVLNSQAKKSSDILKTEIMILRPGMTRQHNINKDWSSLKHQWLLGGQFK